MDSFFGNEDDDDDGGIWAQPNFFTPNPVAEAIERDDVKLEELLVMDELVQEVRGQNKALIDFLSKRDILQTIITYIVEPSDLDDNEIRAFRFPYICSEILCCGNRTLLDVLFSTYDDLLLQLLSFGHSQKPLRPYMAGYWMKIIQKLTELKPLELAEIIDKKCCNIAFNLASHFDNHSCAQALALLIRLPFSNQAALPRDLRLSTLDTIQHSIPALLAKLIGACTDIVCDDLVLSGWEEFDVSENNKRNLLQDKDNTPITNDAMSERSTSSSILLPFTSESKTNGSSQDGHSSHTLGEELFSPVSGNRAKYSTQMSEQHLLEHLGAQAVANFIKSCVTESLCAPKAEFKLWNDTSTRPSTTELDSISPGNFYSADRLIAPSMRFDTRIYSSEFHTLDSVPLRIIKTFLYKSEFSDALIDSLYRSTASIELQVIPTLNNDKIDEETLLKRYEPAWNKTGGNNDKTSLLAHRFKGASPFQVCTSFIKFIQRISNAHIDTSDSPVVSSSPFVSKLYTMTTLENICSCIRMLIQAGKTYHTQPQKDTPTYFKAPRLGDSATALIIMGIHIVRIGYLSNEMASNLLESQLVSVIFEAIQLFTTNSFIQNAFEECLSSLTLNASIDYTENILIHGLDIANTFPPVLIEGPVDIRGYFTNMMCNIHAHMRLKSKNIKAYLEKHTKWQDALTKYIVPEICHRLLLVGGPAPQANNLSSTAENGVSDSVEDKLIGTGPMKDTS